AGACGPSQRLIQASRNIVESWQRRSEFSHGEEKRHLTLLLNTTHYPSRLFRAVAILSSSDAIFAAAFCPDRLQRRLPSSPPFCVAVTSSTTGPALQSLS